MPRSTTAGPSGTSTGHVLRLIRTGAATTRAEIGRITGLSRPAVALRVSELMAHDLVSEQSTAPSSGGRPPGRLEFNAASGVILTAALDIARSQVAVCDLAGRVLAQAAGSPPVERGPAAVVPWLLEAWSDLLDKAGRDPADVRGAGVGVPGTVEFATGRSETPPVLASWGGVDIAPLVNERFPAPVLLDNDVNVMALGEHWATYGAATDDLVFVRFSTGIGAGIVSGGALLRGALGAAGEIGHVPVPRGEEVPCRCGNTDCLEAVAGGPALLRHLAQRGRTLPGLRELAALAQDGDPEAVTLVRSAGRRVGEVLAGAVNLLNPDVIVLGGDLAGAYDHLVAGVREVVFQRATALATRQLRIVPSATGDEAGVLGGAVMVLDHVLAPETVNARIAEAGAPSRT